MPNSFQFFDIVATIHLEDTFTCKYFNTLNAVHFKRKMRFFQMIEISENHDKKVKFFVTYNEFEQIRLLRITVNICAYNTS